MRTITRIVRPDSLVMTRVVELDRPLPVRADNGDGIVQAVRLEFRCRWEQSEPGSGVYDRRVPATGARVLDQDAGGDEDRYVTFDGPGHDPTRNPGSVTALLRRLAMDMPGSRGDPVAILAVDPHLADPDARVMDVGVRVAEALLLAAGAR